MVQLEYIESIGSYRIFSVDNPSRTIGYESDYYKALARVKEVDR